MFDSVETGKHTAALTWNVNELEKNPLQNPSPPKKDRPPRAIQGLSSGGQTCFKRESNFGTGTMTTVLGYVGTAASNSEVSNISVNTKHLVSSQAVWALPGIPQKQLTEGRL